MLLSILLAGCHKSIEDKAAEEAREYTRKYCPTPVVNNTRTDSMTFDRATRTLLYHCSFCGPYDDAALIATNRAMLLRGAHDIAMQLGWPTEGEQLTLDMKQKNDTSLSSEEKRVVAYLTEREKSTLDELASMTGYSLAKTAAILFNLELNDLIHTLPGHTYQLRRQ